MVAKSGAVCAAACARTSGVLLLRADADTADVLCTRAAPPAGVPAAGAARCASALKLASAEMLTSDEAPCSPCDCVGRGVSGCSARTAAAHSPGAVRGPGTRRAGLAPGPGS